jgi:uncharacterized protein YndB with AHSA1/START domain
MENNGKKEMTLVRVFNVPRERVWQAWTDEKLVARWWGPNGVTNPVCEVDARAGGAIHIVMLAGDELGNLKGSRWPMKGAFREVVAPERFVFTSGALADDNAASPFLETLNAVTFAEEKGGTKMTVAIRVTKTTPEAEGPLSGMEAGWNQQLDKLGKFLSGSR